VGKPLEEMVSFGIEVFEKNDQMISLFLGYS
jgi:hypothetical protein